MSVLQPISQNLSQRLSDAEVPRPVYAAVGAVATLRRIDPAQQARHGAARLAGEVQQVPAVIAGRLLGGVNLMVGTGGGTIAQAIERAAQLRTAAAESYDTWAVQGEDAVVAYAAERAVRTRVSRVEDRVAPRAGKAAVRFMERRRRLHDSRRLRKAAQTAQRTTNATRRGARRFAEMNAPVLADEPDSA